MTTINSLVDKYKQSSGNLIFKRPYNDDLNIHIDSSPNLNIYSNPLVSHTDINISCPVSSISYPISYTNNVDIYDNMPVNICIYHIDALNPHLTFLLQNIDNVWSFPSFVHDMNIDIQLHAQKIISKIFGILLVRHYFKGHIIHGNECFMIYETTHKISVQEASVHQLYVYATLYEILNLHECLMMYISAKILRFMINNKSLIYLFKNNNRIDIPYIRQTEIVGDNYNAIIKGTQSINRDETQMCDFFKREIIINEMAILLSIHKID
jgi:hypothetical protein